MTHAIKQESDSSKSSQKYLTRADFNIVIGMEFHLQANTKTKLFSRAPLESESGLQPNTNVSLVDAGMPGALPCVNQECVRKGIITALALNMKINETCKFDRKHYSYPDLPLKYQITQFFTPLGYDGHLTVNDKIVRLNRLALEADAGKSVHKGNESVVDLNRCGAPLMEIVTEPDMNCEEDAKALFSQIKSIAKYINTSDADMEKGQLRADVNVSINLKSEKEYGTRVEIKNLNSINFTYQALSYEINRQIECFNNNQAIVMETRGFDPANKCTFTMRAKESEADYRYIPEPDLPPIKIDSREVESLRAQLPMLASAKAANWVKMHGLEPSQAYILSELPENAQYVDQALKQATDTQVTGSQLAMWLLGDFSAYNNQNNISFSESKVTPKALVDLIIFINKGLISSKQAKEVFAIMLENGQNPESIIKEKNMSQITDENEIAALAEQILAQYPDKVQAYRDGNQNLFGFFVGEAMKESQGRVNPQGINRHLKEKLSC